MGDEADLDLIQRSLEQLLRLNASRRVHARQAAAAGLTLSQPAVVLLRRISEKGPIALGDLARLVEMDPAATGRQVRLLEREGLVARRSSRSDARVTLVEATPRGESARQRIATVLEGHMYDVLAGWSEPDRRRLGTLLSRLVTDLRSVHYRAAVDEVPA